MAMANNSDKTLFACTKCGGEHDNPVGSKCDRQKVGKEEKWDSSKESGVKKTPRGKSTPEVLPQEKILEVMTTTMSSFSEKLEVNGATNHGF